MKLLYNQEALNKLNEIKELSKRVFVSFSSAKEAVDVQRLLEQAILLLEFERLSHEDKLHEAIKEETKEKDAKKQAR